MLIISCDTIFIHINLVNALQEEVIISRIVLLLYLLLLIGLLLFDKVDCLAALLFIAQPLELLVHVDRNALEAKQRLHFSVYLTHVRLLDLVLAAHGLIEQVANGLDQLDVAVSEHVRQLKNEFTAVAYNLLEVLLVIVGYDLNYGSEDQAE